MALSYGFVKCKLKSAPVLKPSRRKSEIQYHIHTTLRAGNSDWDSAINVGTSDADDLLRYKLVYDYHNPLIDKLRQAAQGYAELTGTEDLPALDFLRSEILDETGDWRDSDVMDGSDVVEPVASLIRLFRNAMAKNADVYIFGRKYTSGGLGIHDVHMNQGSTGSFVNNGVDDHNDHNDVWQDGAVLVDLGDPEWVGYFTAFTRTLERLWASMGVSNTLRNYDETCISVLASPRVFSYVYWTTVGHRRNCTPWHAVFATRTLKPGRPEAA